MTTEAPKLTVIDNPTYQPRDDWEELPRWAVEKLKRMTPEQCQQFCAALDLAVERSEKECANARKSD
jgi:hypothetical protein